MTVAGDTKPKLHIKGGTVVNDDYMQVADIYIEDGIIQKVGNDLTVPDNVTVINASGKLVIPGGVDTETYFECSSKGVMSADDFYSGTHASVNGGNTTIINCVTPKTGESLKDALQRFTTTASSKACCDFAFHLGLTTFNDTIAQQIKELVSSNDAGVSSLLLSMAGGGALEDDDTLYDVMSLCRQLGCLPLVHAENGRLIRRLETEIVSKGITGPEGHLLARPKEIEEEAVVRALLLANQCDCPLLLSRITAPSAASRLAAAKRQGIVAWGQTSPASLGVNSDIYHDPDWTKAASVVTSPPLRCAEDGAGEILGEMLGVGDLECVGSGHMGLRGRDRAVGKDDFRRIPDGVTGVEDRMSVVWEKCVQSGQMDACRFVAVTSSNAAKLFNMYPKKGRLAVGSDADVVLWNPAALHTISAATHKQKVDINIFEGFVCHGVPEVVIVNGLVVKEGESLKTVQGSGHFLHMKPNCQHVFGRLHCKTKLNQVQAVKRDEYSGPVWDPSKEDKVDTTRVNPITSGNNYKEPTPEPENPQGHRKPLRTSVKTHQPPGGASSGSLW